MGYASVEDQGVFDLVERVNTARLSGADDAAACADEAICRDIFGAHERIAVYGALAPGEARHYMLTPFRGAWSAGFVRGRLERTGLAGAFGVETLTLHGSERAPVHLLHAPPLAAAWATLDAWPAPGVARLLCAVENADGVAAVANIFAAR